MNKRQSASTLDQRPEIITQEFDTGELGIGFCFRKNKESCRFAVKIPANKHNVLVLKAIKELAKVLSDPLAHTPNILWYDKTLVGDEIPVDYSEYEEEKAFDDAYTKFKADDYTKGMPKIQNVKEFKDVK